MQTGTLGDVRNVAVGKADSRQLTADSEQSGSVVGFGFGSLKSFFLSFLSLFLWNHSSLFAEDANGLDPSGAIRRNDGSDDPDEQEKKSDGGKRERVCGAHAKDERRNDAT